MFFKRKSVYPKTAKYQKGDYVNFRFRDDLYFGHVHDAREHQGKIVYDIQIAGQCPAVIRDFDEEKIVGLKS